MATVLIADDDVHLGRVLAKFLEQRGHRVAVVLDGEEAVAKAREVRPDVLVVDVSLPLKPGDEVVRALRTEGVKAPALFVSARDQDRIQEAVGGLEPFACLEKPLDLEAVAAKVAELASS